MNDDVGDSERVCTAVLSRVAVLRERHTFLDVTEAVVLDIHLMVGGTPAASAAQGAPRCSAHSGPSREVTVLRDQPRQRPVQSFLHITISSVAGSLSGHIHHSRVVLVLRFFSAIVTGNSGSPR